MSSLDTIFPDSLRTPGKLFYVENRRGSYPGPAKRPHTEKAVGFTVVQRSKIP